MPTELAMKFVDHGYQDTKHVIDLLHGIENGMEMLIAFTRLPQREALQVCGLNAPPEYSGVSLHTPCHVGGALAPDSMEEYRQADNLTLSLPSYASLIDRFGPARNQGGVGSCTAFATAAALESQLDDPEADVSERFIYWGTKNMDGLPNSEGSYLKFSTAFLLECGSCFEESWPYVEDREELKLRPSNAAFDEAERNRPASRNVLPARNVERVKAEIADGRAVGISLPIYKSHYASLRFHSEGRFTMPLGMLDQIVGGHAVCAVAYLDDDWLTANGFDEEIGGGAFLIRNSWGEWAKSNPLARHFGASSGYGIVPYRFIESQCMEAISVTVDSAAFTKRRQVSQFRDDARRKMVAIGGSWWERTRNRVVFQARQRIYRSD